MLMARLRGLRGRRVRPQRQERGENLRYALDRRWLAFAPRGLRLAVAHYNGVTLWFPNMAANPEFLEWAGSHLAVTFSPDNKFLVTAMHSRRCTAGAGG